MAKRRGNNEGSIYQRKNGSWVAQIRIEGKRIAKTHKSRIECQNWLRYMREQVEGGLSARGARLSMSEYLEQWLLDIRASVRSRTLAQYEGIVRNYLVPRLGTMKLHDLRVHDVQFVYSELLSDGKSRRTVQLVHRVLHRAIAVAQKRGIIGRNVVSMADPPRPEKREMKVLNDNMVRTLLIAAEGDPYEALFHLAITTGLRQGELLGLKWEDIDWATGSVYVRRQLQREPNMGLKLVQPKTRSGRRMIQLGAGSVKQLARHRKLQDVLRVRPDWEEHDLVFPSRKGTPFEHRSLLRAFKKLLVKGGLPDMRFHDLRHTAATLMLLNGIPLIVVSRRLGHSKPSVTLDVYGHYMPGMQRKAADLMDEIVTPIATKWQHNGNTSLDPVQGNEGQAINMGVSETENTTFSAN